MIGELGRFKQRDCFPFLVAGSLLLHGAVAVVCAWWGPTQVTPPVPHAQWEGRYSIALQDVPRETVEPTVEPVAAPPEVVPPSPPEPPPTAPPEPLTPPVPAPVETPPPARAQPTEQPIEPRPQPSAAAATAALVAARGSDLLESPRRYHNPTPPYPPELLRAGIEGVPVLEIRVAADGQVEWARLLKSSGHRALDDSALATLRRWSFYPARRGGTPVAVTLEVPINFHIRRR